MITDDFRGEKEIVDWRFWVLQKGFAGYYISCRRVGAEIERE
jgi:hypothetical protein